MVFPVVMCQRIDAFELWCWGRLLRIPWTVNRSNQSILKEIRPEYSLEGLMLKLKLQHIGQLMQRTDSWKSPWCWERLKAGGERDDRGWDGWMASLTQWTWVWVSPGSWWWTGNPGGLQSMGSQTQTQLSDWTETWTLPQVQLLPGDLSPWTQIIPCHPPVPPAWGGGDGSLMLWMPRLPHLSHVSVSAFLHLCDQFPILNFLSVLKCLQCFLRSWLDPQMIQLVPPFMCATLYFKVSLCPYCICSPQTAHQWMALYPPHFTYPRPAQRMSPTPAPTHSILMNIPIRLFPRESFLRIVLQYIHWNGMAGS